MTTQSTDDLLDVVVAGIISGEISLSDMYGCRLKELIGLAKRQGNPALARCVAAVAVGYRDRRIDVIEKALRHGLAIGDIDLPFPSPPVIETESAYASRALQENGAVIPSSLIANWKVRIFLGGGSQPATTAAPISHMTPHKVSRLVRELQNVGCPVPSKVIVKWTLAQYVEARRWLDRYHRWQHQGSQPVTWATGETDGVVALLDEWPEAPEFLREHVQNQGPDPRAPAGTGGEEPAT
jgi:hypothetical protein